MVQQSIGAGDEDPGLDFPCASRDAGERTVGAFEEEHAMADTRDQPSQLVSDSRGLVPPCVRHEQEIADASIEPILARSQHLSFLPCRYAPPWSLPP